VSYFLAGRYKPEEKRSPTPPEGGVGTPEGRHVLARLALAMSEDPGRRWDHEDLRAWLEQASLAVRARLAPWNGAASYLECLRRTGLLAPAPHAGEAWVFFHAAFREALAAEALASEVAEAKALRPLKQRLRKVVSAIQKSGEQGPKLAEAWSEPFALVAGHLSAALRKQWLEALLAFGPTSRVAVAALATSDAAEPELVLQVLGNCSDWRDSQLLLELLGTRFGSAGGMLAGLGERGCKLARSLRGSTGRSGRFELLFLLEALDAVGARVPTLERRASQKASEILDELAPARGEDVRQAFLIPGLDGLLQDLPPGRLRMGSPHAEPGRRNDEGPVDVELTRAWQLARVPVTLAQYRLMDPTKTHFWGEGGTMPVTEVSWFEAQLYCRWMNRHGTALLREGWCFRLPTEAEWEYACRDAGRQLARHGSGAGEDALAPVAVYGRGYRGPERVGARRASVLGFHDLLGNVWEWCENWYEEELRSGAAPGGPPHGTLRAIRGGAFWSTPGVCRVATRNALRPDQASSTVGFRLATSPRGRP
jgi:hypothetical protein